MKESFLPVFILCLLHASVYALLSTRNISHALPVNENVVLLDSHQLNIGLKFLLPLYNEKKNYCLEKKTDTLESKPFALMHLVWSSAFVHSSCKTLPD